LFRASQRSRGPLPPFEAPNQNKEKLHYDDEGSGEDAQQNVPADALLPQTGRDNTIIDLIS
jgi:hypothetical protein